MSDTHISETVSAGQLRAFIERIERVEEEIRELNADKSEIYKELRGSGFDVKAVRQCVAARKLDSAEREERNAIFDMYWEALTGASRVHVHEAREQAAPKASNSKASNAETGDLTTAPSELTDTQEQPETAKQSPAPEHKATGHAPRTTGSDGANEGGDDVDGSASARPAGQTIGTEPDGVESGIAVEFIERTTSGPDAKRAPHSPSPVTPPAQVIADDVPPQAQDASSAPLSNSSNALLPVETDRAEAVSSSSASAVLSQAEIPAFLKSEQRKSIADYRPHCLNPDACGATGLTHCYSCRKAMEAASETEAA